MAQKVTWKKGMRLSTDVFDAMDLFNAQQIRQSTLIASAGRYGIVPNIRPFDLSLNVSGNTVEVLSLSCLGVTKSGLIADINFDSDFHHTFDTRLSIPHSVDAESYILVVTLHDDEWREISDIQSEMKYTFALVGENSPIDGNTLPIGRLVNQYGWRLDETDFVPPCLLVGSHPRYVEVFNRAKMIFKNIADRCRVAHNCIAIQLLSSVWTASSMEYISMDKEAAVYTPERLFASLQKVTESFLIGCLTQPGIELENAGPFEEYVARHYDGTTLYSDIKTGLELIAEISVKMEGVCQMVEQPEAPSVPQPPKQTPERPKKPVQKDRTGRMVYFV